MLNASFALRDEVPEQVMTPNSKGAENGVNP